MKPIHATYAAGKWQTLTLAEQMGNIGSDVHRSIVFWQRNDTDRFASAFDRALELFDLTLADSRWRGTRGREIARAREVFCSLFFSSEPYDAPEKMDRYFTEFAIAARRNR